MYRRYFASQAKKTAVDNSSLTVYYHPVCSVTTRALYLLKTVGLAPQVVKYGKHDASPFTRAQLERILERLSIRHYPRALMNDEGFEAWLRSSPQAKIDGDSLIRAMLENPSLIRRPLIEFTNFSKYMNQRVLKELATKEQERVASLSTSRF